MKLAFVAVLALFVGACNAQITVIVSNVTVADGAAVRFECSYDAPGLEGTTPSITWSVLPPDSSDRIKLAQYVEGNDPESYLLSPDDMPLEFDEGVLTTTGRVTHNLNYQSVECEVDFKAQGSKVARFNYAVYKWPEQEPYTSIEQDEFDLSVNDQPKTIGSCVSGYGYPTPTITFFKVLPDGTALALDATDIGDFMDLSVSEVGEDGVSVSTTKDLLKVIDQTDDNAKFECRVETRLGEFSDVRTVAFDTFRVRYATDTVNIGLVEDRAILDTEVTVSCEANGYPDAVISIDGVQTDTFPVQVTMADNGREFVCVATYNNAVTVNSTYTMEVIYNNVPVVTDPSVAALGDSIELQCSGAGNPEPMLSWFKGDTKVSASGTYVIDGATLESNGEYQCRSTSEYDELTREGAVTVRVNGIELVGDAEVEVELADAAEETVTLECSANSYPAATITWAGDVGTPIENTNGMYGYSSEITIGPLTAEHSEAEFTCTASNGIDTVTKNLRLPKISAGGSPIAGIIIGVLVAILLVAVILAVLYNKGIICKKGEKGDETAKDITPGNVEGEDVEAGKEADEAEKEKLMEGNGEASNP